MARAIKLIRTASGLRQKEIAVRVGVTSNYISLVENGKREPSVAFLRRLATALGVQVGLFFLWEQENVERSQKSTDKIRGLLARLEAMYVVANQKKFRKKRVAA